MEYCEGELELFFRDHILYTIVPIVCTRNRLLAVDTFDEGTEGLFSQLILTIHHEIMRINTALESIVFTTETVAFNKGMQCRVCSTQAMTCGSGQCYVRSIPRMMTGGGPRGVEPGAAGHRQNDGSTVRKCSREIMIYDAIVSG